MYFKKTFSYFFAFIISLILAGTTCAQNKTHPSIFITKQEAADIQQSLGKYELLDKTYDEAVDKMDKVLKSEIDVPEPGEAGGYAHTRHKMNYREMRLAGLLFQISGEEKYAEFVKKMLYEYADMYPDLGPHPMSEHQKAGKLFHQTLNETVWLVHTSIAYDCIYNWLSKEDRKVFEENIFIPMVNWFTRDENKEEFNRIHNHGTWMTASVAMIGYVMDRQNWVEMALYGTEKDGEGGFLKQLDLLFSPDGYYMEGPYYIRYALMPFFYFAEAIHRKQPELEIYQYRDQILKKALLSAVQTTYPNGVFPPINDASRSMDVKAPEVILANDITYAEMGEDERLLGVATIQDKVILNGAGLQIARDHAAQPEKPQMSWSSVEFSDGPKGESGGLGILRVGEDRNQSMALMKYGVHGGGHGHFDKLHFTFFDQQKEVIPDYGFSRWINIEPKFGGRYLPENDSYAEQTVAHNTVVVDQTTQNEYSSDEAESMSGDRHFFDTSDPDVKVVSARANGYYDGVRMQRSMLLVDKEAFEYPILIDLYKLDSKQQHTYDYPLHYYGQIITTNFDYNADTTNMKPLGDNYGYQHLWKEAEGSVSEERSIQFTWLDDQRYYTATVANKPGSKILFGRIGANDPHFNLRSEPNFIVRQEAGNHLFASVIEPHGYFNEARETSLNAQGIVKKVKVVGHNNKASVIRIYDRENRIWQIIVNNGASSDKRRTVTVAGDNYQLNGNYTFKRVQPD